jgi:hypothetical protein
MAPSAEHLTTVCDYPGEQPLWTGKDSLTLRQFLIPMNSDDLEKSSAVFSSLPFLRLITDMTDVQ